MEGGATGDPHGDAARGLIEIACCRDISNDGHRFRIAMKGRGGQPQWQNEAAVASSSTPTHGPRASKAQTKGGSVLPTRTSCFESSNKGWLRAFHDLAEHDEQAVEPAERPRSAARPALRPCPLQRLVRRPLTPGRGASALGHPARAPAARETPGIPHTPSLEGRARYRWQSGR